VIEVTATRLDGLLVVQPERFDDRRGFLVETFNARELEAVGIEDRWVQANHSRSMRNVLRGLHHHLSPLQGKLVRCSYGTIFDVAVDLRRSSPTFADWFGIELDDRLHRQLWIPAGFGHGFLVLSDEADVEYRLTDYFDPAGGHAIAWDDPTVGVDWPLAGAEPILSARDAAAPRLQDVEVFD